jgi:hypothetical protein
VDSWVLGGPHREPEPLVRQPERPEPRVQQHYYPGPPLCRPADHDYQMTNRGVKVCAVCGCLQPHPMADVSRVRG